jgi:hypothetical protein
VHPGSVGAEYRRGDLHKSNEFRTMSPYSTYVRLDYNMAVGTYSIEPNGIGAFLVRVTRADGSGFIVGGFPTWGKAREWVASAMLALASPLNGTVFFDHARLP